MTQLWTQLLILFFFLRHLSKTKRQSIFISLRMKGNLCNHAAASRNQCNSFLFGSSRLSRRLRSSRAFLPPVLTPAVVTPAFPPAQMKGRRQTYAGSAAEPRSLLKVRGSDPQASHWSLRARGCARVFQLHPGAEVSNWVIKGPRHELLRQSFFFLIN